MLDSPAGTTSTPIRPARRRRTALLVVAPILLVAAIVAGVVLALRPASTGAEADAAPAAVVPEVGACYAARSYSTFDLTADKHERVDCDAPHGLQAVAVKDGSGESPNMAHQIEWCQQETTKFLGMNWLMTLARPAVSVPSTAAWRAGMRWYRCDVLTVDRMFGRPTTRQGRLTGHEDPVRCLNWLPEHSLISAIGPATCDQAHYGELAGVGKVAIPESRDLQTLATWAKDECQTVVLAYLGVATMSPDLRLWFGEQSTPTVADDRTPLALIGNYVYVPCMIGAADPTRQFTGSLRGVAAGPLPFA